MPANQLGNICRKSEGTTSCALGFPSAPITLVFAAIAMNPSNASSPSIKEYAGSMAALRRTIDRFLVESTAVTECGYINNAIAEPSASVPYETSPDGPGMNDVAGVADSLSCAALNIWPKPCNLYGI